MANLSLRHDGRWSGQRRPSHCSESACTWMCQGPVTQDRPLPLWVSGAPGNGGIIRECSCDDDSDDGDGGGGGGGDNNDDGDDTNS